MTYIDNTVIVLVGGLPLFTIFVFLLIGFVLGCFVASYFTTKPLDREVIEAGLIKTLPSDEFVTIEWIYFHLELSPRDTLTLRHVLELYTEEGVVELKDYGYRLVVNITA